jgi:hypothetical protein
MMTRKHAYYAGVRMVPYDLVKEFLVALLGISILVVLLSAVFSSPDEPPLTLKGIARTTPQIFVQTSLDELDGASDIAGYGPPYNNQSGSVQYIGPISLQKLAGVHIPVNTARDLVLNPLTESAGASPTLQRALARFYAASLTQQAKWENSLNTAIGKAHSSG